MSPLATLIVLILLAFSVRRAVLLLAALWPTPRRAQTAFTPTVAAFIPCRNEATALPGLLHALENLDYPRTHLQVTIIDDGSTDHTASVARQWIAEHPEARLLVLPRTSGKAHALAEGLRSTHSELLVVYDADHHPQPASLRALVAPFAEPAVVAVSGQMRVVNGEASPAAFYAMIESHVHQLITTRAKDRLALAPAVLGSNCAYRVSALRACGGFQTGTLLEDSDLTLALALAGGRICFAPESISAHHAPITLRGYLQQHLRWNRGFHQVTGRRLLDLWRQPTLSLPLKIELTFFALGYADRLALVVGALFTFFDLLRPDTFGFPLWVWLVYFGLPALEMVAALVIAREAWGMFARLVYVPFFFGFDILVALWSSAQSLWHKPLTWKATERPHL